MYAFIIFVIAHTLGFLKILGLQTAYSFANKKQSNNSVIIHSVSFLFREADLFVFFNTKKICSVQHKLLDSFCVVEKLSNTMETITQF